MDSNNGPDFYLTTLHRAEVYFYCGGPAKDDKVLDFALGLQSEAVDVVAQYASPASYPAVFIEGPDRAQIERAARAVAGYVKRFKGHQFNP